MRGKKKAGDERKEEGDERKKKGVFWSINFEKHVEGVCNGMFWRVLKL